VRCHAPAANRLVAGGRIAGAARRCLVPSENTPPKSTPCSPTTAASSVAGKTGILTSCSCNWRIEHRTTRFSPVLSTDGRLSQSLS
jgi:hypothetical protein